MSSKQESNSASAVIARLAADPEFQEAERAREAEHERRILQQQLEEQPLRDELAQVGVKTSGCWELLSAGPIPAIAVPILLTHLARPYSDPVRSGIARCVEAGQGSEHWPRIVEAYRSMDAETFSSTKDALACAVARGVKGKPARRAVVLELLRDERLGGSRILLLDVFARGRKPELRAVLEEFVDDPVLGEQTRWELAHPGRRRK